MEPGTGIPELDDVLARVPMFEQAEDVSSEPLSGGLTNVSHLVTIDGDRYVVRLAGGDTKVLGIDRTREAAAVHNASTAGICPETIAFLLPEGHSVTRYVEDAHPIDLDEARSADYLRRIAMRLRQIHDLPAIDGGFDPYADIERWLELSAARGVPRSRRLEAVLRRVERVRLERMLALDAAVLCHNDSYYLNVLDDGSSLWLIDWEYAGMGDPMYDLAANGFELTSAGKDTLLSAYFGESNDELRSTLDDMITVFLAWNVAWSMVQVHGSESHDYLADAEQLLNLVPPER